MKSARLIQMAGMFAVTAILGGMGTAIAQTGPAPSSMRTIGAPLAGQLDRLDALRRDENTPKESHAG